MIPSFFPLTAGFFLLLILAAWPLGNYMARVYEGKPTILSPLFRRVEIALYRLAGVDETCEMTWNSYSLAVLSLGFAGILLLYTLLRIQQYLPLHPQAITPIAPDLALNTAVSFVTNTNWQNYSGEVTLSPLSQMLGLTVQNFISAATGMAVMAAFIRGITRRQTNGLGNFWVDLTRSILYILLPLSILLSVVLAAYGTVQTLETSVTAYTLQGQQPQIIALGPVASQVAIKHLGTNGGGYFNANAAHPFENPTPLTNFLLIFSEALIPAALPFTFGRMVKDEKQGWSILAVMLVLVIAFAALTFLVETPGNPVLDALGVDTNPADLQTGGNMEGKEQRFGIAGSTLFAAVTTATSSGAVNSMHDSYSPLGGMVLMVLMQLGEVALGGVGSGLYGMLVFVLVGVFIAGLMVGRTPEYLGKKIEPFEMKMAALIILLMPMLVLGFAGLGVSLETGRTAITNPGPHGFSQVLYAFTSQANNNGSAFAGIAGNNAFYNTGGAIAMFIARYWIILPTLALAGSLAQKKATPTSAGTLSTTSMLFMGWMVVVILMVGALNFLPALSLGPVIEHILLTGLP